MSNRTDFDRLVLELARMYGFEPESWERLETELHNAYVAGQEGNGCLCTSCKQLPPEDTRTGPGFNNNPWKA